MYTVKQVESGSIHNLSALGPPGKIPSNHAQMLDKKVRKTIHVCFLMNGNLTIVGNLRSGLPLLVRNISALEVFTMNKSESQRLEMALR